jgi:peptide/nickel transport system substrate-binding protein
MERRTSIGITRAGLKKGEAGACGAMLVRTVFFAVFVLLAGRACAQDHRGGTLRLLASSGAGTLDPQINYTGQYWQLFTVVYDGLVAFRKVAGPEGMVLVPDLADAIPEPTDGGLTYRFHLRPGLQFDGGRPVRASDAAASFRRMFRVLSPTAGSFYGVVTGASACLATPATCALPGVVADDEAGTVTIHLDRPDPELLMKLTLPHASILPADAPDHDTGNVPIPGTGPYRIAAYDPAAELRLERNPDFRVWSTDAQPEGYPDQIAYSFGLEDQAEVTQVENDEADWMFENPPLDRLGELGAHYADRVHTNPALAIWFLAMNIHERPFDDPRVRRAVNLAVDRDAVVKLFGGPRLAVPSCQILPPGLPGYQPYCPFTHDLPQAQALVAASGAAGQIVTLVVDTSAVQRSMGTYLQGVLRQLGFDARLRILSGNLQFTYIQNTANHVQISLTPWYSDYPGASDFLPILFGCAAFHPNSDSSVNMPGVCDPALDARMAAAGVADWAGIDRAVTDQSYYAVLFNPRYIDVTSSRVQHFFYHEQYHWLLAQSWLR